MSRSTTRAASGGLAAAVALVALLAGCVPVGRPAIRQAPPSPRVWDNSDPAVLVTPERVVYLFGSTNNMRVPVRRIDTFGQTLAQSRDHWARDARDAMPSAPGWVDPSEPQIWAPTVMKLGEQYVMWFSAARRATSGSPIYDEHNDTCIGWATSGSPAGPYAPSASPVYCGLRAEGAVDGQPRSNLWGRSALDPEVIRGQDGRLHLLVALGRTKGNIGVVRLDSIGRVIGGVNATPTVLASQAYPWHDGTVDSSLNSSAAFLENPSMIYEPASDTYLLFYSAGQWWRSNYVTGFARCATPTGPCTLDDRAPMLMAGNGRSGVGGLTAFRDGGGTLRVALSSWQAGHEGQSGAGGVYSRQGSWGSIVVSGSDPASQSISIR